MICLARLARPAPLVGFVAVFVAVVLTSSHAAAQGTKDDLTTLEKNLDREHDALSTSDCATACRALASIRRAADKICALDSGERCAAGRAKAEDATRRVREACPECAIASALPQLPSPAPPPAPPREERAMGKGGSPHPSEAGEVATAQSDSRPASESKRGGCAGCTTSAASPSDLGGAALAISALAFVMRRRRKR